MYAIRSYYDGGAIVKSAGTNATVFSHGDDGVTVKLPSGKFTTLNPKNRAMIGVITSYSIHYTKLYDESKTCSANCGLILYFACNSFIDSSQDFGMSF